MSFSDDPIIPSEPPPAPVQNPTAAAVRARRRRANRREMFPADAEGQAALIAALSRRAYPSLELFVFSLACGAIVGLGFLLDSQAVLLLGILVTPLMTPWVGFLLAILTGSPRFLFETLMALFISGVIVFLGGLLTGFAARLFLPITLTNVFIHARLWIPELVTLTIGAITLVASFARSEDKPFLPSIIIAYAFYLPINASGFGLGSGIAGVWPQGILVFTAHFALASVLGLLTLFALRLRPSTHGVIFSGIALLLFVGVMIILMGSGFPPAAETSVAASTPTIRATAPPSATPSLTVVPTSSPRPTVSPTRSPLATFTVSATTTSATVAPSASDTTTGATSTSTATSTPTASATTSLTATASATNTPSSTPTFTPAPKPTSGKVNSNEGGGANLRQTPNGKYIMTLDNGKVLEIYPDSRDVNGVKWLHVFATIYGRRMEGWLLESVVTYDAPAPNLNPSATPTP